MAKKSRNDYYPDYSVFSEGNGDVLKRAVKGLSKVLGTATEKYKDTVFRMLLNDKKVALEVYNAINGSDYDDPDDIRLPEPKFVVFYNGNKKVPKRYEMRLSKAYERQTEDPSLELKIDVVNINPGCNDELLRRSPTLHQYMEFVEKVKRYSEEYPFEEAMTHSVDECIREDILADFFEKNRAEVLRTSIFVYDQEKHMRQTYEEGVHDGEERGIQIGEQSILTKLVGSKVKKGYTLEQTAEALDYPVKELEPIYNMVRESESGYTVSQGASSVDDNKKK